ncbi:MAG: helicase-associated domain-containing protein [Mycobacteriales bacterium]
MTDDRWLRALGEEDLAALLKRRPEAVVPPVPACLSELAERLDEPYAVVGAMRRLDRPTLQVAEVVAALGGQDVDRAAVLGLLDGDRSRDVGQALATLAELGLLSGAARLTLVEAARYAFGVPLDLGPPLAALLAEMRADDIRAVARNLDLKPPSRKAELVAAVAAALRDPERVRSVVAAAPAPARQLLHEVASTGRPVEDFYRWDARSGPDRPARWAYARGLLLPVGDWSQVLAMPGEVALALRGESWRAPFDPDPPALVRVPVPPSLVDRDAAAAGGELLRTATGLLDAAGRAPVPQLRGGGVGVRELRRLAKSLGCLAGEVKLALSIVHAAGLLALADDAAAPSDRYDGWLADEPPERLATLVAAWWALPYVPLAEPDAAWKPVDEDAVPLREALLAEAAAERATAPADPAALAALVEWRRPFGLGRPDPLPSLQATWLEAARVGATGAGAVGAVGRALLDGAKDALPAALAGVGAAVGSVTLQADLTAVVAGTPDARLSALLDGVAGRESAGVASVWRFSPDSVRRALDAGLAAEDLLARLGRAATTGLPQPLTYLIRDVARRHGRVRGGEVACYLRSDEEATLAEMAADRRLRRLGLRTVAPTVLVGSRPLGETLAALRAAGYAPVAEGVDGEPAPETAAVHRVRAADTGRNRVVPRPEPPPEAGALARTLLARTDSAAPVVSATLRRLRTAALTPTETRLLAHAIDSGGPVLIEYRSQSGGVTRRVIEEAVLDDGSLTAWCRLRDDERRFSLHGILSVTPA